MKMQSSPTKRTPFRSIITALAAAGLLFGASAQAQNTFNYAASGDWDNTATFTEAGTPSATDNIIANIDGGVFTFLGTPRTINDLSFGSNITSLFQVANGSSTGPFTVNVNGTLTTDATGPVAFRGGTGGTAATRQLAVNINNIVQNAGILQLGQWNSTITSRELLSLNVSGTTTLNGGTLQVVTAGATATFGQVNFSDTTSSQFWLNAGSHATSHARTIDVAGLNGGLGSTIVAAGNNTLSNAATTLRLTGSGNYDFAGRILNRTDNSVGGSIVSVEVTGTGSHTLSGSVNSGYSGNTTVSTGTLIINTEVARTPLISVADGARFGGSGSASAAGATLNLDTGSQFIFDPLSLVGDPSFQTFNVENVTFSGAGTFSLSNLVNADGSSIVWSSIADGTYTLVEGTVPDFATWVDSTVFDIGGGRTAFFQEGSLQLVVVPEPSTYAAILGLLALGFVWFRRRKG